MIIPIEVYFQSLHQKAAPWDSLVGKQESLEEHACLHNTYDSESQNWQEFKLSSESLFGHLCLYMTYLYITYIIYLLHEIDVALSLPLQWLQQYLQSGEMLHLEQ